jgi:lipopolysaccharide/colanic/teichoic acid biosynthesis glycosyltransferase
MERAGWLFTTKVDRYSQRRNEVISWGFHDQKAFQMYKRFLSTEVFFVIEAFHIRILQVLYLAYNFLQNIAKRCLDLLIVFVSLPIVLPVLMFTAVLIKLDSPGPIIYKQQRVGKWGRRFTCYKLRSMCLDAEKHQEELKCLNEADEVVFKIKCDPRITRIGHIIRKLSIDELPQIFNVIKGDMSLIGPRPPVPCEVEQYTFDTFRRLETLPGITGLQQVSGRSNLTFKRWVELDLEYIRNQSLKKDIDILVRTVPAVISGKGAY